MAPKNTLQLIMEKLDSPAGSIFLSVLLGLGLAALFRKACTGNNCIVIHTGPQRDEIESVFYKVNNDCFKYQPVLSECK